MGMGVPGVWTAAGQVDPLTGLAPLDHLRTALWEALLAGERLPLAVVVTELPSPGHPVEHARRLTLAGAMAQTAFGSALAVGRLGVRRVGVLSGRDPDLHVRAELLAPDGPRPPRHDPARAGGRQPRGRRLAAAPPRALVPDASLHRSAR